jgi:hypothetical protein
METVREPKSVNTTRSDRPKPNEDANYFSVVIIGYRDVLKARDYFIKGGVSRLLYTCIVCISCELQTRTPLT